MRLTSWLAFIAAAVLTFIGMLAMMTDPPEEDLPSYLRGSVRLEGSARQ